MCTWPRFRGSNHIDAAINLVLRSALTKSGLPDLVTNVRIPGKPGMRRASRRTANEIVPAAILRDGASRLLRMRSAGISSIRLDPIGFMESIY